MKVNTCTCNIYYIHVHVMLLYTCNDMYKGLTVSSVMIAYTWVQNMIQVNREKRKPSNTPSIIIMNTRGPGNIVSQSMKGERGGDR